MSRIEYYDPDGVFALVSPQLHARLPLKNLHWSSSSRPLRFIPSLDVEFHPRPAQGPAHNGDGKGTAAGDESGGGRKHQLAGLRSTPLVKCFVLRCDDRDSYKATKRPLIQEWLDKDVRAAASKQGGHDACEWFILHVVLPNTPAATQPRWTKTSSTDDEGTKEKSASKRWPGKGARGIFEKLRSDFASEKKSDLDHVAQIRLRIGDLKPEFTTYKAPDEPPDYVESAKESENAWSDLFSKLKAFILSSLNARVSRYEEDIHARDAQRSLPGWNFCTFFVLKEALALLLESAGLIEDAITIYDELSVGFESILLDTEEDRSRTAKAFARSTAELSEVVRSAAETKIESQTDDRLIGALQAPLDTSRKNYRELIASSSASIFDMRCYLTARQITLLLKLATPLLSGQQREPNGNAARSKASSESWDEIEKTDNMSSLERVCKLVPEAITALARFLRQDLYQSVATDGGDLTPAQASMLNVITACWTYAACHQFLSDTATFQNGDRPSTGASPRTSKESRPSVGHTPAGWPRVNSTHDSNSINSDHSGGLRDGPSRSAAYRADVCLLQRRVVEKAAEWNGWKLAQSDDLSETAEDANDQVSNESAPSSLPAECLKSLPHALLSKVAESPSSLRAHYQELSDVATALYTSAGRVKSAERLMADVGIMKYNEKEYAAAAIYLGRIASKFGEKRWGIVESRILRMQMTCLRMLNRKDDCLRAGLQLLARDCESRQQAAGGWAARGKMEHVARPSSQVSESPTRAEPLLDELAALSKQLTYDVTVPLEPYFTGLKKGQIAHVLDDRDGFKIGVNLWTFVAGGVTADAVEGKMSNLEDDQSRRIDLRTRDAVDINSSDTSVWLESNISSSGRYAFDQVAVRVGRIVFAWEPAEKRSSSAIDLLMKVDNPNAHLSKQASVSCFSRPGSFQASITASRETTIGKGRSLELRVCPGADSMKAAQVKMRSATAGLRLKTADASAFQRGEVRKTNEPGLFEIGSLEKGSETAFAIPYDLESPMPTVRIRMEVTYHTGEGAFCFCSTTDINVELELDVAVRDIFRDDAILSEFTMSPVGRGPLRLLTVDLADSRVLSVQPLSGPVKNITASRSEPARSSYRLSRPRSEASSSQAPFLTAVYESVLGLAIHAAGHALRAALVESPFNAYENLLIPNLEPSIQRLASESDLEYAALADEFLLPSIDSLGLRKAIEAVESETREPLLDWLMEWHARCQVVPLPRPDEVTGRPISSTLKVEFAVPQLAFMHTASIQIQPMSSLEQGVEGSVKVGVPMKCTISTRHTTQWNGPTSAAPSAETDFQYELCVDTEMWAVVGARKAHFKARPGQDTRLELTLIALRSGRTQVPHVLIRTADGPHQASSHWRSGSQDDDWMSGNNVHANDGISGLSTCETNCTTARETISILDGWRATTVGLSDHSRWTAEDETQGAVVALEGW